MCRAVTCRGGGGGALSYISDMEVRLRQNVLTPKESHYIKTFYM